MNDLFLIAGGSGLQDGLNPYMFMSGAVFIVLHQWFKKNRLPPLRLSIVFVICYLLSFLVLNFSPAGIIVLNNFFFLAAKIIYSFLGVVFFVLGLWSLKDWHGMRLTPGETALEEDNKPASKKRLAAILLAVLLPVLLSALATLWPVTTYMMLLGNESMMRGQWSMTLPLLFIYASASLWPLWFILSVLNMKSVTLSMLKILSASVFFISSSCLLFIFK